RADVRAADVGRGVLWVAAAAADFKRAAGAAMRVDAPIDVAVDRAQPWLAPPDLAIACGTVHARSGRRAGTACGSAHKMRVSAGCGRRFEDARRLVVAPKRRHHVRFVQTRGIGDGADGRALRELALAYAAINPVPSREQPVLFGSRHPAPLESRLDRIKQGRSGIAA